MAIEMAKKVLLALSGGVDSSVCVHLLKEQGYEVAGVVMRMSSAHGQTVEDARCSAEQLDIPLIVRDMQAEFDRQVVDYFVDSYKNGRTPNPCVVCNPLVKFKALLETADAEGFDWIATGHYAKLTDVEGYRALTIGESKARDQSYMLFGLDQRVLSRLMFPLAELGKDRVREIAAELGLACAQKPDSQEICFIPDNDYAGYIERRAGGCPPGTFISPEGTPCGTHKGILHYTVGQRKGLGIALGRPVFVKTIDPTTNQIFLADGGDELEAEIMVGGLTYCYPESFRDGERLGVKIRSRAPVVPCTVHLLGGTANIVFDTPQRAPAKGQAAVLYRGEVLLGGGFIK